MRRGEVWWAGLPPPAGARTEVLISWDEAYSYRELVTVAPVTRRIRGIRVEMPLGPQDSLPTRCAVNLDSMTTIPIDTIRWYIASLRNEKLEAVDSAIHFALGL